MRMQGHWGATLVMREASLLAKSPTLKSGVTQVHGSVVCPWQCCCGFRGLACVSKSLGKQVLCGGTIQNRIATKQLMMIEHLCGSAESMQRTQVG